MKDRRVEDTSRLYTILSHPMRKEIIRILGETGMVGLAS